MSHGYGSYDQQYGAGATADGPGRSGQLDRVLADLMGQAPEVEAAAVVSFDGLPMASALPAGMDEDRVAAMSAALLSLGERAAQGLGRGDLNQVYVEGQTGTVFLVSADDEAVLVAVGARGAKVGLMLFEVRQAADRVAAVLREVPVVTEQLVDDVTSAEPQVVAVPQVVPVAEVPVAEVPLAEVPVVEVPQVPVPVAERPLMAPMNELPPAPAPIESLPPVPVPVAETSLDAVEDLQDDGAAVASVPQAASNGNGSHGGPNGTWPVYPAANGDTSSWS
jgi:predicted regulator of Ras-like GTPase activity (Roadblock/LC7/MglB family)